MLFLAYYTALPMWPFSKKESYISSGVLRGATDWHCHLLPGVDDGIKTMEETLETLTFFQAQGVREVWFTPHIMEDIPNETAELRERFLQVQEAWTQKYASLSQGDATSQPLVLHLAAENMLDRLFEERLEARDLLPLGEEGDKLLVETSFYNPPYDMWGLLRSIKNLIDPMDLTREETDEIIALAEDIIAHPERYQYMDEDDYDRLHEEGVLLQLNLPSLVGAYGPRVRHNAQHLLAKGYYSFAGSDTHRLSHISEAYSAKILKKTVLTQLASIAGH